MTATLLTIAETAQRLRLAESTVQKLCQSGRLASCRFGRRVTIAEDDLAAFIAASRCAPRSTHETTPQP